MHAGPRCPFQRERLRRDGTFRAEVAYCAEHGIPHSEFLARWSNEDRAKLMAHLIDKADRCTMCGTADWEWQANREAYIPVMRDCWGCKLKDAFRVGEGDQIAAGRSVVLISREEADRLAFDPTVPRHGPGRRRSRQRSETK